VSPRTGKNRKIYIFIIGDDVNISAEVVTVGFSFWGVQPRHWVILKSLFIGLCTFEDGIAMLSRNGMR
jgi:hypothetical protein